MSSAESPPLSPTPSNAPSLTASSTSSAGSRGNSMSEPPRDGGSTRSARSGTRSGKKGRSSSKGERSRSKSRGKSKSRRRSRSRSCGSSQHGDARGDARTSCVRFSRRVQYRTIRHIHDFKRREIDKSWYCKSDYERMLEDVRHISELSSDIVSQSQDFSINGMQICSRGLEHLIDEDVADYRSQVMTQALDAVLDEQEIQQAEGYNNPDLIATIYGGIGVALQREAYLVALRDALEVLHIEGLGETSAAKEYETMSSAIHDEVYNGVELGDSDNGVVGSFVLPEEEERPDPRVLTSPCFSAGDRWKQRRDSPRSNTSNRMPAKPKKSKSPSPNRVSELTPLSTSQNGSMEFRDQELMMR